MGRLLDGLTGLVLSFAMRGSRWLRPDRRPPGGHRILVRLGHLPAGDHRVIDLAPAGKERPP
jgi:hypothetical protein